MGFWAWTPTIAEEPYLAMGGQIQQLERILGCVSNSNSSFPLFLLRYSSLFPSFSLDEWLDQRIDDEGGWNMAKEIDE